MAGGLLCVAVGLTVMAAWFVRATAVLRFGSQNPMSFNTALAFVVTGVALVALARRRPRAALAAGVFDAVLGALILAEYALRRSLGIDQLFVKAYLSAPHVVPGRPAVNTAKCLALTGTGLLVWGPRPTRRPPAAGVESLSQQLLSGRAGRSGIYHRRHCGHSDLRVCHRQLRDLRVVA